MVATTLHSVTMVFWKETTFPFWRAMDRRWNWNAVSLMSSIIVAPAYISYHLYDHVIPCTGVSIIIIIIIIIIIHNRTYAASRHATFTDTFCILHKAVVSQSWFNRGFLWSSRAHSVTSNAIWCNVLIECPVTARGALSSLFFTPRILNRIAWTPSFAVAINNTTCHSVCPSISGIKRSVNEMLVDDRWP